MIKQTVHLQRATHTASGYKLVPGQRDVIVEAVVANSKNGNPQVAIWWGSGGGMLYFSLNTGWGEAPVKNYRITDDDLARLRTYATEQGLKVKPKNCDVSDKRKGTRRPKDAPGEQLTFWGRLE